MSAFVSGTRASGTSDGSAGGCVDGSPAVAPPRADQMFRSPLTDVAVQRLLNRQRLALPGTPFDPKAALGSLAFPLGSPRRAASGSMANYESEAVLGTGAFGLVSRMRSTRTGELVAVKVIDRSKLTSKTLQRTVRREIEVLKRLDHPSCVRLLEVEHLPGTIHLVLEYVDACTVEALMEAQPAHRLDEETARAVLWQLLGAVEHCHDRQVCHRDIKLENVLLDRQTRAVKLIDFGMSVVWKGGAPQLSGSYGTLCFMAPEMVRGVPYRGPPLDVWSIGVSLAHMLTGELPFTGPTDEAIRSRIVEGRYELPRWVSPDASELVKQILQHDPEDRLTCRGVRRAPWLRELRAVAAAAHEGAGGDRRMGGRPTSAAGTSGTDPSEATPDADAEVASPAESKSSGESEGETSKPDALHATAMAELERLGFHTESVAASLEEERYNHEAACYHLVRAREQRRQLGARQRRTGEDATAPGGRAPLALEAGQRWLGQLAGADPTQLRRAFETVLDVCTCRTRWL